MGMNKQSKVAHTEFTLTVEEPGKIGRAPLEVNPLNANEVRIQTLYSGISAGTEMTAYLGSNPYLKKRWNPDTRLFEVGEGSSMSYPMPAIGYEEIGEVSEVGSGVTEIRVGQKIWGAWGHQSMHVADEAWAAARILDERVEDIKTGIFSQMGGIALNAVVDADIHVGEYVAVFGQGVPGLMVTQLARANGAEVIAIDRLPARLDAARESGAAHTINSAEVDAAAAIQAITGGRGADVTIEITGNYHALHDAIRSTAFNSKVVVAGFMQGDGHGLFLGEEFHHNRIQLVCSQIGGLNSSLDHRWDRMRLDSTAMKLQAEGRVDFGKLVSHTFKISEAQEAFDLLTNNPNDALQVVLDFSE
jgi:2-desacetyl-2-hydroxyethyl bacteriochlorophyllide A dehydrogenase